MADQFGPIQDSERFGQGVVIAVAARANEREGPGLGHVLGMVAGEMLHGRSMWWISSAIPAGIASRSTRQRALTAISEDIEAIYNRQRRRSTLSYLSSVDINDRYHREKPAASTKAGAVQGRDGRV
jgi:hypothetical protein